MSAEERVVDFDLHGYVGIRLLDARADDVKRVERQLGPLQRPLQGQPDITVRFVERIEQRGSLVYVALEEGGFDDASFYVLRGKGQVRGRASIPFQDVGGSCQIVCERSLPAVPLLLPIINMTALAKGLLPLHASAFNYEGQGILATGWAKGGKTETLLAFMEHGARYVGDEWIYLTQDRRMFGIPEPIRLWRWQLEQLPLFGARLRREERLRLAALDICARGLERVAGRGRSGGAITSILRRGAPVVRRQVNTQVPPARLFGSQALALSSELHRVLLLSSHEPSGVQILPVKASEVARRMIASGAEERHAFMSYYRQFRFAFPQLKSPVVERASTMEAGLLRTALAGLPAAWVRHPYPVEIATLYDRLSKLISS